MTNILSVFWSIHGWQWLAIAGSLFLLVLVAIFYQIGAYWLQAFMSRADVSLKSLIVMRLLRLDLRNIVNAKIMASQSGMSIDRKTGASTERLMAHHLTGGDVTKVIRACIVAKQADIAMDFERAAAVDLAGRDVLLAVQTSVSPMIIGCPRNAPGESKMLSAVAKNGVEVLVDARVTVRTELDRIIGGATEETIIARVGQAVITAIGSANSHMDVLAMPSNISKGAMLHGLDKNTAFAIVSIDIYHLVVGENIGARLQSDQADADVRIARAEAEGRRADAVAMTQLGKAQIAQQRAALVLAEAQIPTAIAQAFRSGKLTVRPATKSKLSIQDASPALNFAIPRLTKKNSI